MKVAKSIKTEVGRAVEKAWKVPGLYRKSEGEFLYKLARRKGNIVELGCWMGRTTSILVQAARVWGATVTSVDPFTPMPNGRAQASAQKWMANLWKIGLKPPSLMAMTSDAAAPLYTKDISFLFIDGNHAYEAVVSDLRNWCPKVKVGGVVALHDMFFPSITGVCRAVSEWWSAERVGNSPSWSYVGQRDFTIAFKRVR